MFTCYACGTTVSTTPHAFSVGLLCNDCAAFMHRAEASFEDQAVREAEETARISRRYRPLLQEL